MAAPSRPGSTIGDLSRRTGVKVQTIRYYETTGLLPAPGRTAGNQRRYDERAADTLQLIRRARDLGFETGYIRELLTLAEHPERPCADATAIARRRLEQVERRIAVLRSLRGELNRMIRQCPGGRVGDCRVMAALAEHTPSQNAVGPASLNVQN